MLQTTTGTIALFKLTEMKSQLKFSKNQQLPLFQKILEELIQNNWKKRVTVSASKGHITMKKLFITIECK